MTAPLPLHAAFDTVRAWLDQNIEAEPPVTFADDIAMRFDCDDFSRNILLLSAYAALEPDAESDGTIVTAATALTRLPRAHWAAFAADAPLRKCGLLQWSDGSDIAGHPLRLAEPVLLALLGAPALSAAAAMRLRPLLPAKLSAPRAALADAIERQVTALPLRPLTLSGPDNAGKALSLASACAKIGQPLWSMPATLLPLALDDLLRLAQTLSRDLTLCRGRLLLTVEGGADETQRLNRFLSVYGAPVALAGTEVPEIAGLAAVRLEMPRPTAQDQAPIWAAGLGPYAARLNGGVARLAQAFPVAPEIAETVAADLDALGAHTADDDTLEDMAWQAARRAARPRLDDLAQRIDAQTAWESLILPPRTMDMLKAITAQARHRAQVYETWGFAERLQQRGLGITVLFSGPSGTGKTHSGEVIATELGLDLYRVDLSALVSKWLGETEKNLRRVFDAAEESGVALQFDEADALFGKRGEVREAHDRNANLEVSYLLQRLEAYRGLSILTTNLRDNIDEAFLRRLRFIVDFRFPTTAERRAIWERILPADVPRKPLNFDVLAGLNVSGGSIRNIALSAAFLAAEEDAAVDMDRIRRATMMEYAKTGRIMTDTETSGWRS